MLFQVYKALVGSHLRHAEDTKISALQRLQNRALDIIETSEIKDSLIRPAFSIYQMVHFNRSFLMFEIINEICPESLRDKFAVRLTISKYGIRNKTDLQIPKLNLDFSRKSFN